MAGVWFGGGTTYISGIKAITGWPGSTFVVALGCTYAPRLELDDEDNIHYLPALEKRFIVLWCV